MITEIYVENYRLDLTDDIETDFTYAIDDVNDFGSKNTSYSKTITIAGNGNNNQIFGFVFDLGNANFTDNTLPNVNYNFNASKSANCKIFLDKIQIFKGVLRLLEIVNEGGRIEYQVNVFGELGGFITALGNQKLENLDFGIADQTYNETTIANSWDTIAGSGVYYPLIDYGGASTLKVDFDFKTFKPALFVRQYLEKIIGSSGYTWDFPLLSSALMNRLVIPNNQIQLTTSSSTLFDADATAATYTSIQYARYTITTLGSFTASVNNDQFTYTPATSIITNITCNYAGLIKSTTSVPTSVTFYLKKNATILSQTTIAVPTTNIPFGINLSVNNITFNTSDNIKLEISSNVVQIQQFGGALTINSTTPTDVPVEYGDAIVINDTIPKGIFQKDFFLSICKMFNLYVYDSIFDEKKLIIKPYVDFYDGTTLDWSNKIDRNKPFSIKPMSEVNARYYQFKYKSDNDFYNDNYKKKFNEGYADNLYDSEFDFVRDTDVTEIIFASSPLYQATGTDKIYPAIYKKSNENTKEDKMDSVIRILQAKKITGKTLWTIKNGGNNLAAYTAYGYAGHLDDPYSPTNDINFGAPKEIYFDATTYPTTNLFNAYYSDYMAEITDKNSKLLTCYILLNSLDIQNLDFSKLIYIDGVLFRLNKVENYNPIIYTTSKVELLKVIQKTF
jgi:hypothetical protein